MTIDGIDISNNNPDQDYSQHDFVFLKATEGETYQDATYTTRHAAVRNAGKIAGAYLFYRTASTPTKHVEFFHTVAAIQSGDIVALDFENDGTWAQYSNQALAGMATQTMQLLLAAYTTNRVVLYCTLWTYNNIIVPYNVPIGDGLWIAEPSNTPTMPWVFWQYGQSGIDLDKGNFDSADKLHVWVYSKGQLPPGTSTGEVDWNGNMGMGWFPAGTNEFYHLVFPCGPDNSLIAQWGAFSLAIGGPGATADIHVWYIGTEDIQGGSGPRYLQEMDVTLKQDARWEHGTPDNTDQISVLIRSANYRVAWCLELKAK